jgi:flagellin-like protein
MKSISPIVALAILMLMTVAAGGMAYITLQSYQEQVQQGSTESTENLATIGKSQARIESIAGGKVYVRNMGAEPLRNIELLVEGRPVEAIGPDECDSGKLCVFEIQEELECQGDCSVQVISQYVSTTPVDVAVEEIAPSYPPRYSNWGLNATNVLLGEEILANVTWDSELSSCTLDGGCYYFSNQTMTTREVGEFQWT